MEAGDQAVVLAHDDVPPVIGADVVTAVPPECRAQVGILDEQAETLAEFVAVRVVQSPVAALAVIHDDFTASVGQHWSADRE